AALYSSRVYIYPTISFLPYTSLSLPFRCYHSLLDALPILLIIYSVDFPAFWGAILNDVLLGMGQVWWKVLIAFFAFGSLIGSVRSEQHTSEFQSRLDIVCRILFEEDIYILYIYVATLMCVT